MADGIAGYVRETIVASLKGGSFFLAPREDCVLFCQVASTGNTALVLVLASSHPAPQRKYPYWLRRDDFAPSAFPVDAKIELVAGAFGVAFPNAHGTGDGIGIDRKGVPWIAAEAANVSTTTPFDLTTGSSGQPEQPIAYYDAWRLVWTPPWSADPITLYERKPAPLAE